MKPKEFEYLIDALKILPSVSSKSADKIAHCILNMDDEVYSAFIKRIVDARINIKLCIYCNNITSNSLSCEICSNIDRQNKTLCIVTTVDDLYKIEKANSFFGTYYVLQNEVNYKNKESIKKIDLTKLEQTINKFGINEILIATNMTVNGELTCNYVKQYLSEKQLKLDFYRLGLGIPFNASIDYIDWESLKFSIKNKNKI